MRETRPLVMAALVFLFLAEGQRAFVSSLFGLGYEALFPSFRPAAAVVAILPLAILAMPFIPLARWVDRRAAVAIGAGAAALFRLPMTHPALETRLLGGALVLGSAAVFIMWSVGYMNRRALAAGAVLGLVLDQLLRLAGTSYDLSLRPWWFPVQAVLSALLVGLAIVWTRSPDPGLDPDRGVARGEGLERRAGGLRLRGGLALGALLFVDLHVLGVPPVAARSTSVDYVTAAAVLSLAAALAVGVSMIARHPTHRRGADLGLSALVALGLLTPLWLDGTVAVAIIAAGHVAALLLITRALEPASGRRGAVAVTAGLITFITGVALYSLTFYHAFVFPALAGAAPWIFAAVALLVAGCFILMPRPSDFDSPPGTRSAAAAAVAATLAVALVVLAPQALAGPRPPATEAGGTRQLRVATWNLHYGFSEDWRFDPAAIAETLESMDADVVALQEVPAGLPTAYNVDFPLWLGRRVEMEPFFSATVNDLLGDAFLTTVPGARMTATPLPAGGGDPKQLLTLQTDPAGAPVRVLAVHLGVEEENRPAQLRTALSYAGEGAAVLLGDLNSEEGSVVVDLLAQAGFHDVFRDTGRPAPTFPATNPSVRIDWIWVRGLRAEEARVIDAAHSDHRAVLATLQFANGRVR